MRTFSEYEIFMNIIIARMNFKLTFATFWLLNLQDNIKFGKADPKLKASWLFSSNPTIEYEENDLNLELVLQILSYYAL